MARYRLFGLIGKNISYSFSRKYFTKKIFKENLNEVRYKLFDIPEISHFNEIIAKYHNLEGLNITIPYKESILTYLTDIEKEAKQIGAVNTVKIKKDERIGYNTDMYGFEKSFIKYLMPWHKRALVLGQGGAAKSIGYVLRKINIPFIWVSRNKEKSDLSYKDIDKSVLEKYQIIVNCTPLGTYPNVDSSPLLPYQYLSSEHYLYDLVYNPSESLFLKKGKIQGAITKNGLQMLYLQAERAWEIWNIK